MNDAKRLRKWTVTRSGSGLVARGENIDTGKADKITNIERIEPPKFAADHHVHAVDNDGVVHTLTFV